jgi:hypothetical protein
VVSCWLVWSEGVGWFGWLVREVGWKVSSGQCPAAVDGVVGWFGGQLNVARWNGRAP